GGGAWGSGAAWTPWRAGVAAGGATSASWRRRRSTAGGPGVGTSRTFRGWSGGGGAAGSRCGTPGAGRATPGGSAADRGLDVGDHLLPAVDRVDGSADDLRLGDAPEVPHLAHLGDGGHWHGVGTDLAEARGDRVLGDDVRRRGQRRGAVTGLVERDLGLLGGHVVDEEVGGEQRVLAPRADVEALHAGERLGGLTARRRDRVDGELDITELPEHPRAADEEGRLAVGEGLHDDVVLPGGVEVACGPLLGEPLGEGGAGLPAHGE